ncbi:CidA/LrgA family protein [Psychrobacter frigidicola]|uniref:CidA/LrgA family protein n=1 Tax=Psychrobacter frigidicola TaxID=45611 RepID=UPI001D0F6F04|nr:CidA/LrgA family protein [Psychrobacter frigidicola]
MKATYSSKLPLWLAIILTLVMVIVVRESAVVVCDWLGIEKAANVVGMVAMFLILMTWRVIKGLPSWLTKASNMLLVDSGFAFLPVSAGAGILLFELGDELLGFMLTIVISTVIPLWGLAILANRWLSNTADSATNTATNNHDANNSTDKKEQP